MNNQQVTPPQPKRQLEHPSAPIKKQKVVYSPPVARSLFPDGYSWSLDALVEGMQSFADSDDSYIRIV
jgi:hypothetical protein